MAQTEVKLQTPLREVAIIATEEGFYPKQIAVHEGEKVRFFVTSIKDEPDCFVINGHKIFMAATKGKMSEQETIFTEPGRFKFYCPSSKSTGHLTVIDKAEPVEVPTPSLKKQRGLAGDYDEGEEPSNTPSAWTPRDY